MSRTTKNNTRAILLLLLTASWLLFIFVLSAQSAFPVSLSKGGYDIVSSLAHVGLYFILAVLVVEAAVASGWTRRRALVAALVVCALYGASDEWHQSFVPGREMGVSDWLLDVLAAFIVVILYSWLYRFKFTDR